MSAMVSLTLSELQSFVQALALPAETRINVLFEDSGATTELLKRKRALEAMRQLKASGNGNLLNALLSEREKDSLA